MTKQQFIDLRDSIESLHPKNKDLCLCLNKIAIIIGDEEAKQQLRDEIYEIAKNSENGSKNEINGVKGITLVDPVSSINAGGVAISSRVLNMLFKIKAQRLNKTYVHGIFIPTPTSLLEDC